MNSIKINSKTPKIDFVNAILIAFFLGFLTLCGLIIKDLSKTTSSQIFAGMTQNQKEKLHNCYNRLQIAKETISYTEQYEYLIETSNCLSNLQISDLVLNMQGDVNRIKEISKIILPSFILGQITTETTKDSIDKTVKILKASINTPEQINQAAANARIENNIKVVESRLNSIIELNKLNLILDTFIASSLIFLLLVILIAIIFGLPYIFVMDLISIFKSQNNSNI